MYTQKKKLPHILEVRMFLLQIIEHDIICRRYVRNGSTLKE